MTETRGASPPGNLRLALWSAAFSVLGVLGNHLALPISLNIDYLFGSVFALAAVALLGPSMAFPPP